MSSRGQRGAPRGGGAGRANGARGARDTEAAPAAHVDPAVLAVGAASPKVDSPGKSVLQQLRAIVPTSRLHGDAAEAAAAPPAHAHGAPAAVSAAPAVSSFAVSEGKNDGPQGSRGRGGSRRGGEPSARSAPSASDAQPPPPVFLVGTSPLGAPPPHHHHQHVPGPQVHHQHVPVPHGAHPQGAPPPPRGLHVPLPAPGGPHHHHQQHAPHNHVHQLPPQAHHMQHVPLGAMPVPRLPPGAAVLPPAGLALGPPPPGLFSAPDRLPPAPPPQFQALVGRPQQHHQPLGYTGGPPHHHHQGERGGYRGGRGGPHGRPMHADQPRRPNPHAGSEKVTDDAMIREFEAQYNELVASSEENVARSTAASSGSSLLDVNQALATIEANDITFVVTDTGTGKSSLIPKALIELGHRVVSSQPRRTATVNLAARVAELRKETLGTSVGYRVRGEKAGADDVPLMYMTSYTLLLYLLVHPQDLGYSHFIIDEFHERQPEVEVVIALLKLAKKTLNPKIKIVLMSASVETHAWRDYFKGFSVGEYSTCETRFPVHEYFLESSCRLVGAANTIFPLTATVESVALKNNLFIVKRLLEFLAKRTDPEHSVLVFLPGRTLVEELAQYVAEALGDRMEPIPWYRDIELDRVHAAIQRHGSRRKKVYLATDIAEVSITIPDLVFVIDSGTTKKPRIDSALRNSVVFPPLELLYISRSALAQRRGRIGRVQPGFFFTCIPKQHVDGLVDLQPQIAHTRIDELSMHLLLVTSNPFDVFALCRSAPLSASVHLSENILVDAGCALPARNPIAQGEAAVHAESDAWTALIKQELASQGTAVDGQAFVTTAKGYIVQRLPLSVSGGLVVVNGLLFGMESESILAAAILSAGSPFYTFYEGNHAQHRENTMRTSQSMKELAYGETSDIVPSVLVLLRYKLIAQSGLSDADEEGWCRRHCCARSRMQTILKLEKQIREQLAALVSFVDVEDIETVLRGVEANPARISWLVASAFMERAVLCERDTAEAQRMNSVGRSLFMQFDALADQNVATVTTWAKGNVVVPTTVAERYRRLLGSFAVQLPQAEFFAMLLGTSFAIVAEAGPRNVPGQPHLMATQLHSTTTTLAVEANFARLIVNFREGLCARMRLLAVMVEKKLAIDDEAGLRAAAGELYTASPMQISQRLVLGLDRLLMTARTTPSLVTRIDDPSALNPPFAPTLRSAILSKRASTSTFSPPPPPSAPQPAAPAEGSA